MFGLLQVSGAQAICWSGLMPFDAAEEMRSPLNSPQERERHKEMQKVVVRIVHKSTSSDRTCRWINAYPRQPHSHSNTSCTSADSTFLSHVQSAFTSTTLDISSI